MRKISNIAYVHYPRSTHTRTYTHKHTNTQINTNVHVANTTTNALIFVIFSGAKWSDVWTIRLLGRARYISAGTFCFGCMFMCARVSHLRVCTNVLCGIFCVFMCPRKHLKARDCDLFIWTWTFYIINFGIFLLLTLRCRLAVTRYKNVGISVRF